MGQRVEGDTVAVHWRRVFTPGNHGASQSNAAGRRLICGVAEAAGQSGGLVPMDVRTVGRGKWMGSSHAVTRLERASGGWDLGEGTRARGQLMADPLQPAHSELGVRSRGVDIDQGSRCRREAGAYSGYGRRFSVS